MITTLPYHSPGISDHNFPIRTFHFEAIIKQTIHKRIKSELRLEIEIDEEENSKNVGTNSLYRIGVWNSTEIMPGKC